MKDNKKKERYKLKKEAEEDYGGKEEEKGAT